MVNSFTYDPMHQVLLGWAKHLIAVLTGSFNHTARLRAPFVLQAYVLHRMDSVLIRSKAHSPSSFGRHLLDLTKLSMFKAEDFKLFGLHYGAVVFQGQGVHEDIKRVWKVTAAVLSIAFDPMHDRRDIQSLQQKVAILHAQFCSIFFAREQHSFVYTPTTHASLDLPDMLRECEPLTGISQVWMARVAGEAG